MRGRGATSDWFPLIRTPQPDTARHRRATDLFLDALERPATERSGWLYAACGGASGLLAEVEALLAAHDDAEATGRLDRPLLDRPEGGPGATGAAREAGADPMGGWLVGPWRVGEKLGEGGMGAVYRAARADGLYERTVALKLLRPGPDLGGGALARRLTAERHILARLAHPHVARLYDGGVSEGAPYLVMELVEGAPITAYAERHALDIEARLQLFLQVCDAVAYAHQRLVVHRDLKPSNVLVAEEDGAPSVKLLDFGIATLLADDAGAAALTATTSGAMTPAYAAPELLRGEPVTTATDVYALGVLLYELLAERRPYDLAGKTAAEVERLVCERDPLPPSQAAAPERARRLRGDLDVVVAKALAKEPARRYASAEALADDLRRHLGGLPVEARPATVGYRARKFVARHRTGTAAAVLVALALVGGAGVALWQARTAAAERDRAQLEADKAEEVSRFLQTMLASVDPFRGDVGAAPESLTVAAVLRAASAEVDEELAEQPAVQASIHRTIGLTFLGLGLHTEAEGHLRRALALRERLYPAASHPDRIQSLDDLATLAYRLEDVALADSLLEAVLRLSRARYGPRSPEVAGRLAQLASNRPLAAAEPLFREAHAIIAEHFGAEAFEAFDPLLKHATQRMTFGDWVGADSLFARALAIAERHGRADDLTTSILRTNWSSNAFYLGHYDQAEQLLRRALATQEALLPNDHPRLAETRSNYAGVLVERGRYREAERLLRQTKAVFETQQPLWWAKHAAGAELGAALAGQGRDEEAEPLLREHVDAMRRQAGDAHGWTRHFARHLVAFYDTRNRPEEADPYRHLVGP